MSIVLKRNYHMHTARCGHAEGEDRAYVETAIAAGFETIGFSDHTPYPAGYRRSETVRMPHDQLEDYVSSVLSLRAEYKTDGFDRWKSLVEPYPFDYFIQGQHYIGANDFSIYSGRPTSDPMILKTYADRCVEGIRTGTFLYLAHPDLVNFTDTDSPVYEQQMRRICLAAKERKVPLEINLLGINRGRNYPCRSFWKIAGEVGNDAVIGIDAHDPQAMQPKGLMQAEEILNAFGLHHTQNLI